MSLKYGFIGFSSVLIQRPHYCLLRGQGLGVLCAGVVFILFLLGQYCNHHHTEFMTIDDNVIRHKRGRTGG